MRGQINLPKPNAKTHKNKSKPSHQPQKQKYYPNLNHFYKNSNQKIINISKIIKSSKLISLCFCNFPATIISATCFHSAIHAKWLKPILTHSSTKCENLIQQAFGRKMQQSNINICSNFEPIDLQEQQTQILKQTRMNTIYMIHVPSVSKLMAFVHKLPTRHFKHSKT